MALAQTLLTKFESELQAGKAKFTASGKITNIWDLKWHILFGLYRLGARNGRFRWPRKVAKPQLASWCVDGSYVT